MSRGGECARLGDCFQLRGIAFEVRRYNPHRKMTQGRIRFIVVEGEALHLLMDDALDDAVTLPHCEICRPDLHLPDAEGSEDLHLPIEASPSLQIPPAHATTAFWWYTYYVDMQRHDLGFATRPRRRGARRVH